MDSHALAPALLAISLLCAAAAARAQDGPRVVSIEPANGDVEVDAARTDAIIVTFDQPMDTGGFSFCGGGPAFPVVPKGKRARWKGNKTCILPVTVEPDHAYSFSLNCGAAQRFRSKAGEPLAPVQVTFVTLPTELPDPATQRRENAESLAALQSVLAATYSYYEHCGVDWGQQFRTHAKAIERSKTTRGWAHAVGRTLAAADDLHLYLRIGGATIPTAQRAVDPLYRGRELGRLLTRVMPIGDNALVGCTADEIGYLMIGGWNPHVDLAGVERALEDMRELDALVVDVRPNSGGDELLARRIAAWFVDGDRVYAKNRFRTGDGEDGFGPVLDRVIRGNPAERRFEGRVALLTSRYVMSSNEAFVLMMRQAENCTVVGQPTYGSSGNPQVHELPNGVELVAPSWLALRPDGTCFENEGIEPDILVECGPADFDGADPILARALELLRAK